MFTVDDTVDATTPYRPPSSSGGAKLVPTGGAYGYGQEFHAVPYQEPNMAETGYGAVATPLLSPLNTSQSSGHMSPSRHDSGQWGSVSEGSGSGPYPNADRGMSFSTASGAIGYASGGNSSISGHQPRQMSRVEHEEDAGSLPMPLPEEQEVEKLPPTYNPNWLEDRQSQLSPSSAAGSSIPQPPPGGAHATPSPPPLPSKDLAGGAFQPPSDAKR